MGAGSGVGRRTIGLNVIVSKFSLIQSISNRFMVSIHIGMHTKIFGGYNFTVHVYIYRDSEERFTCRPTCRYIFLTRY